MNRSNVQGCLAWRAAPVDHYPSRLEPGTLSGMSVELLRRITLEPGKCGGKPCVRGPRIRVTDILALLAHEASMEEILADHPELERADILAVFAYAAHLTGHAVVRAS